MADGDAPLKKSCRCGTTRDSSQAVVERDYSFMGTLYLMWGGTAIPEKVRFRCVKCGSIFDESAKMSDRKRQVV